MFADYEDLNFEKIGVLIPKPPIEKEVYESFGVQPEDNLAFLKALCRKGYEEKLKKHKYIREDKQKYIDQIKYELDVYEKTLFVDYLLLNWWIVRWCRENDIVVNPRGSAASSLVLYFLGISRIDPIKHGLIFERFLSADRISFLTEGRIDPDNVGDIDLDLPPEGRDKLLEYLQEVFKNRFCKLINFQKFSSPILLKECCKLALEYNPQDSEVISKAIPKPHGRALSLDAAEESVIVVQNLFKNFPQIKEYAKLLENLYYASGSHASAYLTMAVDIDDSLPVEMSKEGDLLCSWDMENGAQSENIKVDLLSVRGISLIEAVCQEEGLDQDLLDYEDPLIYEVLQDLESPYGLFQISSPICLGVAKKVKPKNINELIDTTAIARPGALSYIEDYLNFKKGKENDLQE